MPRKKRVRGRQLLLTDEVRKKLIEATKMGSPVSVAAAYVGIGERTFQRWMQRGYEAEGYVDDGEPVPESERPFLLLYQEITQARSQAAVMHVGLIQRAAQGGVITEESTRKYRDPDTGAVVEEKTVKRSAPDWRAGAWYLERQHRQHFGKDDKHHVELTGPGGGAVEVVEVEALADRIRANIAAGVAAAVPAITDGSEGEDVVDGEVVD